MKSTPCAILLFFRLFGPLGIETEATGFLRKGIRCAKQEKMVKMKGL